MSIYKYLKRAVSAVIIFEFTSFATVPLLYIASYLFDLSRFYLNINANLNNRYQVAVIKYASNRLKFVTIEPHSSLMRSHPWLNSLQITPVHTKLEPSLHNLNFYLFTGYRPEQISSDCPQYLDV